MRAGYHHVVVRPKLNPPPGVGLRIPFDDRRLDALLDQAGIDVLIASSKQNIQYLLGGYRFIFFSAMEAIGHSRYLPVLV